MSQDSTLGAVANVPGAVYRQSLNSAVQAICTYHAGLTEPPVVYPFMQWWDLSGYVLRIRDPSNTSWSVLGVWFQNKWFPYSNEQTLSWLALAPATISTIDPTITNDIAHGYQVFSMWLNTSSQSVFVCCDPAQNNATWRQISGVPAGVITMYGAAATTPEGWITCDGRAISRTTYGRLFSAVGTTWGGGDGWTTFNVPNLNGQFIRGQMPGSFPAGSWWPADILYHGHNLGDNGHAHTPPAGGWFLRYPGSQFQLVTGNPPNTIGVDLVDTTNRVATGQWVYPTGGAENRPAAVSVQYIIKF